MKSLFKKKEKPKVEEAEKKPTVAEEKPKVEGAEKEPTVEVAEKK
ncbi:MAG: hypothetical protein QMD80_09065 [archaeon]|nr:hypothetical protein [archaeon]